MSIEAPSVLLHLCHVLFLLLLFRLLLLLPLPILLFFLLLFLIQFFPFLLPHSLCLSLSLCLCLSLPSSSIWESSTTSAYNTSPSHCHWCMIVSFAVSVCPILSLPVSCLLSWVYINQSMALSMSISFLSVSLVRSKTLHWLWCVISHDHDPRVLTLSHMHTQLRTFIWTHVHMHVFTYINVHIYTVRPCLHPCIQAYIYTHACTRMHGRPQGGQRKNAPGVCACFTKMNIL